MDVFTGKIGPREIALAAAFGLLLGLMPKTNLTVVLIAVLFFFSRANLILGLLVAVVVTFVAPWIYPIADQIGREILTSSFGQDWGARLFRIPPMPWTLLDNTVVLGTFIIGVVLFLPAFLLTWIPLKMIWPKKTTAETPETEASV